MPALGKIERHNAIHLPCRSWRPICMVGQAGDLVHKWQSDQYHKRVPEVGVDDCCLGSVRDAKGVPRLVARCRRTQLLPGQVAPRKRLSHEHEAKNLSRYAHRLGYHEAILKCDGAPMMKRLQEEVKRLREPPPNSVGQLRALQGRDYRRGESRACGEIGFAVDTRGQGERFPSRHSMTYRSCCCTVI